MNEWNANQLTLLVMNFFKHDIFFSESSIFTTILKIKRILCDTYINYIFVLNKWYYYWFNENIDSCMIYCRWILVSNRFRKSWNIYRNPFCSSWFEFWLCYTKGVFEWISNTTYIDVNSTNSIYTGIIKFSKIINYY